MRIKSAISALVLSTVAMGSPVSALVVQSDFGIMTRSGQNFDFNFTGLPASDGTGATITLWSGLATQGTSADNGFDIDGQGSSGANEFVRVRVDDYGFGVHSCGGTGQLIENYTLNGNADCEFSFGIAIAGDVFDNILADSKALLQVNFGSGVGHFGDGDRINVRLSYNEFVDTPDVPGVPDDDTPVVDNDPVNDPGVVPTPLPATGLLLLGGLAAIGATRRRKSRG